MKTKIEIVLLPVNDYDRKKDAERIEAQTFTREQLVNTLNEKVSTYEILSLTDFIDLCNDDDFNISNYWVSYVSIISTAPFKTA